MKIKLFTMALLVTAFSFGCSNENADTQDQASADIKDLVHEYSIGNSETETASITSSELVVTDENEEVTKYELPADEFFVSIAPFKTTTHPCDIHSLTGCQGELVEEEFNVLVQDSKGATVLDESKKTEANGFIDLWLPREDTFKVTITQGGQETTSDISTFDGDNTCITTMQLG